MGRKNRISEGEWLRNTLFGKTRTDLSHHPVFRSHIETTKIRPVYDKSCNDPSLYGCLIKGQNLIKEKYLSSY